MRALINKKALLKALKDFPEEFSIDQLLDRLIVLQKINRGMEESEKGEVYSVEEAQAILKKWLK